MLNDYIDTKKKEMVDRLIEFIRFPSVAKAGEAGTECGLEVEKAQNWFLELASSMGFRTRKAGKCAEVVFGGSSPKKEKVYIAAHADVVPAGDGWTTGDPFTAVIRNGKIYGRGVLDDKGPALAVLYAMKALKELNIEPAAEIRLIVGGCEETDMSDLKEYVAQNGLPDYGLTPDSSYPIIYAEAGLVFGRLILKNVTDGKELTLRSLHAGQVYNAVPDLCNAVLSVGKDAEETVTALLKKANADYRLENGELSLTTAGKSAHGSCPEMGINAAFRMTELLKDLYTAVGEKNSYVDFGYDYLAGDTEGKKIGIACQDEPTGKLTLNVGIADYSEKEKSGFYSFDIRVPVTLSAKPVAGRLTAFAAETGAEACLESVKECFCLDPKGEFLTKLSAVYEKITGRKGECLAAKGGTYAKAFGGKGVAFGPIDESDPEAGGNLHGIDEYFSVDAYIELAKVYAEAIRVLWC